MTGKISIDVLSKKQFIERVPNGEVVISIQDPDHSIDLCFSGYKDFLQVRFWDVEQDIGKYKPISGKKAERIAQFITKHKGENFVIHCEAGVSRSAGVALAVECINYFDGDKYLFATGEYTSITAHPKFSPNLTVYDRIMQSHESQYGTSKS